MTGKRDMAEDVVQDSFIKVFKHLDSLVDEEKMEPWIKTIVRRTALDYLRKERKWNEQAKIDVYYEKEQIDSQTLTEKKFQEEAWKKDVLHLISKLKGKHAEVLLLKLIDEQTDEDIALLLHMSVGTVKSRIHRAREQLKKLMELGGVTDEKE